MLGVDDSAAVRGAIRDLIQVTTPYQVCDAVGSGVSAIHKAMERRGDLILLHLTRPLQDVLVTASLLRGKLPHVKIVGFSTFSVDLENCLSQATWFDAVVTRQDAVKVGGDSEGARSQGR